MANLDQEKLNLIVSWLKGIQYGSLVITVHEGQITQVDRTEKNRFINESKRVINKH